jgi:hypothetical protein
MICSKESGTKIEEPSSRQSSYGRSDFVDVA